MPERHEMHESWRPGFWEGAGPITGEPLWVDTSSHVDVDALAERVRRMLGS